MWKMSIHYTVLGFDPTTLGTWVSSHNHYTLFENDENILSLFIISIKMQSIKDSMIKIDYWCLCKDDKIKLLKI